MERKWIDAVLHTKTDKALLRGWIKRKRDFKGTLIWLLRDGSGEMQAVLSKDMIKDTKAYEEARKALMESSIEVEGIIKSEERAPGGKELHVEKVKVIHAGEEFPIGKDLSEDFLLDVRHLWLRSTKMQQGMKASAVVFEGFHDFCKKEGYLEVQCPMFVSGAVEGGNELFDVEYFGKKVQLTQSSQFYLEVYAHALEKVYTIAPSFRAEPSRTRRHLTEFWHAEWETAFSHIDELMDWEERMIKHIAKYVLEKAPAQLEYFGRKKEELQKVIKEKFPRYTYDEVFKIARKKFPELKWGDDLQEAHEREITKDFDVPILVHHYPAILKPFYHRPDPERKETVLCCDMLAPEGYGEIIGSGERCWTYAEIITRMKEAKLKEKDYQWYVDLRKYGSVPHTGGGVGLSRLTVWLFKMQHIRDAVGFPRTMNRVAP
ncbi:MAG: asparagine--tRNA ligase [Candidatus Diapherotrites archaeon]